MQPNIELMSMFWTTAGIFPGQGEISRFPFEDRVKAISKAGFTGMGFWHTDLEHILQTYTLQAMKQVMDDHGIKHIELEFLTDWFLEGGRKAESDNRKRFLLTASEALHAKHIKVGDFYNCDIPLQKVTESFASLCSEADKYGATIGFEIMGCAVINSMEKGIKMVTDAAAPNGGLIIDVYQVENLGITFEQLKKLPLEYLVNVELNDGLKPSNPQHDPANRSFCGDGEYNIRGLIDCAKEMGYQGPWGVEVISSTLCKMPIRELSQQAFNTSITQFKNE